MQKQPGLNVDKHDELLLHYRERFRFAPVGITVDINVNDRYPRDVITVTIQGTRRTIRYGEFIGTGKRHAF